MDLPNNPTKDLAAKMMPLFRELMPALARMVNAVSQKYPPGDPSGAGNDALVEIPVPTFFVLASAVGLLFTLIEEEAQDD